ncbi:MAG: hypothetical protein ABSA11_10525 [Candidatus Bathyarchaeia archaeon]
MYITNWNNKPVEVVYSKDNRPFLCDYSDNLIRLNTKAWPHPFVAKKLRRANRARSFSKENYHQLCVKLGFYCDLQSLRSEDAISWSVFGSLEQSPQNQSISFLVEMLNLIGIKTKSKNFEIDLWSRIPHPDTHKKANGPEIDFSIVGDDVIILGESKWESPVDKKQGKMKNKDQLQLRREYLDGIGSKIYSDKEFREVLIIGNEKNAEIGYPSLTWEQVCTQIKHPAGKELERYYDWKMIFLPK